jgi:plastocyanin
MTLASVKLNSSLRIRIAFVSCLLLLTLPLTGMTEFYGSVLLQAQSAEVVVQIDSHYAGSQLVIDFRPATVTIPVGGKVTWQSLFNSTVTTLSSDQAGFKTDIPPGGSFSFVFNKSGTFEVTAEIIYGTTVSAKMTVTVMESSSPPPSQPPPGQPQPPTGVQEYVFILALSNGTLHAFPGTLNIAAGSLRLFLTSLDRTVTLVLRKEGAEAGVATVLVESGKVATVEAQLSQGNYGLFDQSSNAQLGQIVAQ